MPRSAASARSLRDDLERLMDETGMTYRGLAAKTGLSAGYLNHLVHGNRPVPSNDVIAKLAKALGVEPEHFLEYRIRVITDGSRRCPTSSIAFTGGSAESSATAAARVAGRRPRRGSAPRSGDGGRSSRRSSRRARAVSPR